MEERMRWRKGAKEEECQGAMLVKEEETWINDHLDHLNHLDHLDHLVWSGLVCRTTFRMG